VGRGGRAALADLALCRLQDMRRVFQAQHQRHVTTKWRVSSYTRTGKALLALTDDRLKLTIGVSSLGVRQRIVSEIKSLNRRPLPQPPGQSSSGAGVRASHMQMVSVSRDRMRALASLFPLQVLEKEFEVALSELSKAEIDVKEKRLAVATYEQKVEESKRLLSASEARLVDLRKNVESVREKVLMREVCGRGGGGEVRRSVCLVTLPAGS
jgi:hypothetical protein